MQTACSVRQCLHSCMWWGPVSCICLKGHPEVVWVWRAIDTESYGQRTSLQPRAPETTLRWALCGVVRGFWFPPPASSSLFFPYLCVMDGWQWSNSPVTAKRRVITTWSTGCFQVPQGLPGAFDSQRKRGVGLQRKDFLSLRSSRPLTWGTVWVNAISIRLRIGYPAEAV